MQNQHHTLFLHGKGEHMTTPIPSLIVPTLNGHDRLQLMLNSIDYPIDKVIVIDNGNTNFSWKTPANVETLHVIRMPVNLGVAGSWNLGIKSTPFVPYWLIVNDDVTFAPGSLERFAWEGENVGTISLSGAVSAWCAFVIGQDVVNAVGLFDEIFYPAYFEDTDYARRARHDMGEDVIYNTNIAVEHANSSTICGGFNEHNNRTYHENYRNFEFKLSTERFEPLGWQLQTRRENDWGV
jgi:GT2 family glycosyltransferase